MWTPTHLALLADRQGLLDESMELHGRALSIDRALKDRSAEATDLDYISNCLTRLGRLDEALRYADEALQLIQGGYNEQEVRAAILIDKSLALWLLQDGTAARSAAEEAVQIYGQLIEESPYDVYQHYALGISLLLAERPDDGIGQLTKAVGEVPRVEAARDVTAWSLTPAAHLPRVNDAMDLLKPLLQLRS